MLVLSRRANESIMIGDDVVVTVLEVRGDHVRLGISAPKHVKVHREEVLAQLTKANQDAARPSAEALERLRAATLPPDPAATAEPPSGS